MTPEGFKKLFASNFFTRAQVDILRRLYAGTLTQADADLLYEALGAVADHEAALNPHPIYLTQAEGDAIYAAIGAITDPWTHIVLPTDFAYSSGTTEVDITDLAFTPAASKRYRFEFRGSWSSSTTAANSAPCFGLGWPTGGNNGAANAVIGTSNGSTVRGAGYGATIGSHSLATPAINTLYPITIDGFVETGASPSGDLKLTVRTLLAGAHVITVKAGSILSWREIP